MKEHPSTEHQAFRAFEHAGWQSVALSYQDHFASLTSQALGPLLDAVGAGRRKKSGLGVTERVTKQA